MQNCQVLRARSQKPNSGMALDFTNTLHVFHYIIRGYIFWAHRNLIEMQALPQ